MRALAHPDPVPRASATPPSGGPDTWWPTPEPPHRINQIYLEPVLFAHAAAQPRIRILNRTESTTSRRTSDGVTRRRAISTAARRSTIARAIWSAATAAAPRCARRSAPSSPARRWCSACSRPTSARRTARYAAGQAGLDAIFVAQSAPLRQRVRYRRPRDLADPQLSQRRRAGLRLGRPRLGDPHDPRRRAGFRYEVLSKEDWIGRRLVADRFRDRRVFICGDAAHLWVPYAGYGMNAGIADAINLSWLLAARAQRLGATSASSMPTRRAPADHRAGVALRDGHAHAMIEAAREPCRRNRGRRARRRRRSAPRVGKTSLRAQRAAVCCAGLNFGYFYDGSPIIAYDGEAAPAYTMGEFTPSTVPGCRAAAFWLATGARSTTRSGRDYTLLRLDPDIDVSSLTNAAAAAGVPLTVLDIFKI